LLGRAWARRVGRGGLGSCRLRRRGLRTRIRLRNRHVGSIRIDEIHHEIGETNAVVLNLIHQTHHLGDGRWAGCDSFGGLTNAVFNALRELDLAFAGKQFDGTHFAHVHAHRVGGSAEFTLQRRAHNLLGLFGGFFLILGGRRLLFEKQGLRVRGLVIDLDAHVVDHVHDRLNLVGVMNILRQVVVDLPVREETLFLALQDQFLELGTLCFLINRHRWTRGNALKH